MKKMYKDGITKFVNEKEVQEYKDWGFVIVEPKANKPEPMVIEEKKETKKEK